MAAKHEKLFQSTLPVWGVTNARDWKQFGNQFQSTLPVWGVTCAAVEHVKKQVSFQSTLPVWGVTTEYGMLPRYIRFQSTLPVWGVTRCTALCSQRRIISIHTPRVGSDCAAAGY